MNNCNNCEPCDSLYSNEGCEDNLKSSCMTYTGPSISFLDINNGDKLDDIFSKISNAITNLVLTEEYICPDLSNMNISKINMSSISISYETNNNLALFKYSLDGGSLILINSNPFIINSLNNTNHTISIKAVSPSGIICNHIDGSIDMSPVTSYYTSQSNNTLPTQDSLLSWTSLMIEQGSNPLIPFYVFNSSPKYLLYAEPNTEPVKTEYYFSNDDKGFLGSDGPWSSGVIIGAYRVYITNYATQTTDLSMQFKITSI